jgi:trafficking protein particle complex subunit 2
MDVASRSSSAYESLSTKVLAEQTPQFTPHPTHSPRLLSPFTNLHANAVAMSYYFVIVSPTDKPLFDLTFGTSKAGGDGVARFRNGETSRYMNQFIVHASLDIVEEVQWLNSNM